MDIKDDDEDIRTEEQKLTPTVSPVNQSAIRVTAPPPRPLGSVPSVKKVKKQADPEVIFACNSCDYKNTLEMVRSHKLSANHMNHMDSRKRNGTIYGLRVAIVPNSDEDDEEEQDADEKTVGEDDGGAA